MSYAATGRGRLTHLTMELLQARAGIKLQLVPYAGGPAQAMNDVMSGRVPLVLDGYAGLAAGAQGQPDQGARLDRAQAAARVRESADHGRNHPGFFVGAWNVMLAPLGTPDAIVKKVNADLRIALDDPDVRAKFAANGGFVRHITPDEVTAFVQNEQKTWRPILEKVAKEARE